MDQWNALAEKLRAAGMRFMIEPQVRFKDQRVSRRHGPARSVDNAPDFKAFADRSKLFAK